MDDVLITGTDVAALIQLKQALDQASTMKELGLMRCFTGTAVSRTTKTLLLLRGYILNLLTDTDLFGCKPTALPLGLKLSIDSWSASLASYYILTSLNLTSGMLVSQLRQFMSPKKTPF